MEEVKVEETKKTEITSMVKKLSRYEIVNLLQVLNSMTIDGLTLEGKKKCIFTLKSLTDISNETEELKKSVIEKSKTEEYKKLKEKAEGEKATEADKKAFNDIESKINQSATEILTKLFEEEVDAKIYIMTEDEFFMYIDANSKEGSTIGIRGYAISRLMEIFTK